MLFEGGRITASGQLDQAARQIEPVTRLTSECVRRSKAPDALVPRIRKQQFEQVQPARGAEHGP
jgi:hypothetical protein